MQSQVINIDHKFWKHELTVPTNGVDQIIDKVFAIYKTPLHWIESIAFRKHIDLPETQTKFNVYEKTENSRHIGPKKFNLSSLIKMYNYHYENWILNKNVFNEKIIYVLYENLLYDEGIIDFFNSSNLTFNKKILIPELGTVSESQEETYKNPNYLDLYKKNNKFSSLISNDDRRFIIRNLNPQLVRKFYHKNSVSLLT
jgi:hypothetical protein